MAQLVFFPLLTYLRFVGIDQLVATSNSLGLASMRQSLQNHGHGPLPPLTATSAPSSTTRSYGNSSGMGYTNGAGGLQRHISTSQSSR
jgi:hypothetical protein